MPATGFLKDLFCRKNPSFEYVVVILITHFSHLDIVVCVMLTQFFRDHAANQTVCVGF